MTIDQLNQRLRWLVVERQSLHERGAAADELERNRLGIVRAQQQLSNAYVALHHEPGDRAA